MKESISLHVLWTVMKINLPACLSLSNAYSWKAATVRMSHCVVKSQQAVTSSSNFGSRAGLFLYLSKKIFLESGRKKFGVCLPSAQSKHFVFPYQQICSFILSKNLLHGNHSGSLFLTTMNYVFMHVFLFIHVGDSTSKVTNADVSVCSS